MLLRTQSRRALQIAARLLAAPLAAVLLGGSSCAQSPHAAPPQQPPARPAPRFTPETPPLNPPAAVLALGDADPDVQRLGVQSVLDRGVDDPGWLVPIQQELSIHPQL